MEYNEVLATLAGFEVISLDSGNAGRGLIKKTKLSLIYSTFFDSYVETR